MNETVEIFQEFWYKENLLYQPQQKVNQFIVKSDVIVTKVD